VVPASLEIVFDFFVDEMVDMGYQVTPKNNDRQIQIVKDNDIVTIDLYEATEWPGYDTKYSVFWHGE
jgi:hypothetical protein